MHKLIQLCQTRQEANPNTNQFKEPKKRLSKVNFCQFLKKFCWDLFQIYIYMNKTVFYSLLAMLIILSPIKSRKIENVIIPHHFIPPSLEFYFSCILMLKIWIAARVLNTPKQTSTQYNDVNIVTE